MFENKIRMTRFQHSCWWRSRTIVEEFRYNGGCSSTVEKKPSKHVNIPVLKSICELERAWSHACIVELSVTASIKFSDECWSKLEIGSTIRINFGVAFLWSKAHKWPSTNLPKTVYRVKWLIKLVRCMYQNLIWNNNHLEQRTSITNIQTPQLSPSSNLNHYFISHDCDLGYTIM